MPTNMGRETRSDQKGDGVKASHGGSTKYGGLGSP